MDAQNWEQACESYGEAWRIKNASGDALGAFWLAMSSAEAMFHFGDLETAYQLYGEAFQHAQRNGVPVVGNPLFHLRVGQCLYALATAEERSRTGPGTALDNLARALIGAGVELFDGEDPAYLAAVTRILQPPQGFESWTETRGQYQGATRDLLSSAVGWLRKLLILRGVA